MTDTTTKVEERMADAGYEAARVDGKFWAWRRKLGDGSELRVCTIEYQLEGNPAEENWYCGRHTEGAVVECNEALTLERALALAERLPSPLADSQTTLSAAEIEGAA